MPILAAFLMHFPFATPAASRPALTGDYHLLSGATLSSRPELVPGIQRLSVNLDYRLDSARLFVRNDFRNRFEASSDSLEWAFPEAWVELYFNRGDLRIGRQVIMPGLSLFQSPVNRLQPLDLRNFLLEPEPVLRRGTIAANYSLYAGNHRIRLIVTPVFTETLLPDPQNRWFFHIPVPGGLPFRIESTPNDQNAQAALLWNNARPGRFELQAGVLYWTPSQPVYFKEILLPGLENPFHTPELLLQESWFPGWVLTGGLSWEFTPSFTAVAEAAWFQKRAFDRIPEELLLFDLQNPVLISLPRILQIIGEEEDGFISKHQTIETALELLYTGTFLTIGAHWSAQIIYDPHPDVIQESVFHTLAATARRDFFRQRLQSELTTVFQPWGSDFWVRTEHSYDLMDNVTITLGAHFFGGPAPEANYGHASFGSYRSNSLIYTGIRCFF